MWVGMRRKEGTTHDEELEMGKKAEVVGYMVRGKERGKRRGRLEDGRGYEKGKGEMGHEEKEERC